MDISSENVLQSVVMREREMMGSKGDGGSDVSDREEGRLGWLWCPAQEKEGHFCHYIVEK